jgi:hypothetical protein
MNPERIPYAAIADLESVVKTIAAESKSRVFILFDPQKGWWAGDETDEVVSDEKSGALLIKGRTYEDWQRHNIAEALSALAAARFIPGNTVSKLFRRATPEFRGPAVNEKTPKGKQAGVGQQNDVGALAAQRPGAKKTEARASPAQRR